MISHATALLLRDSKVSVDALKPSLEVDHRDGVSFTFHRRPGYMLVVARSAQGEDSGLLKETAPALAKQFRCETAHLYAFTGTVNHCESTFFDPSGRTVWASYPPGRRSAESRAIERKLGQRMLTEGEVEKRLDSDDADILDDELILADLPYWKMHLALGLPGKSPHHDLLIKPALEVIGTGWKKLEHWSRPLTDQEQKERSAAAAHKAKRVGVVRPALEEALAKLAKDAGRDVYAVSVGKSGRADLELCAATESAQKKVVKELSRRSLLLRKSKFARKTGLRFHPGVWKSIVVKGLTLEETNVHLTVEDVRRHFGKVQVGLTGYGYLASEFAEGSFEFEDPDGDINAWNALCDLRPADVVQVLAETDDERLEWLFERTLAEQAKLFVREDVLGYVPLIAAALLASIENGALQNCTWMFLEASVKKLATNAGYVKTLRALFEKQPDKRMADALARVGVKVTPRE